MIVCGSVDFKDYDFFKKHMERLIRSYENIRLVSGHARGADTFAEEYAAEMSIPIQVFPAEWKRYGKAAGPIRNRIMLDYAKEEKPVVVAFWDGQSRGTGNMLKLAREAGAECHVLIYEQQGK